MAGDYVHKVADTPGRVVGTVQVDVDATGRISERSRLTQTPHQPLQGVDVLPIEQHRADQFHAVFLVRRDYSSMFLTLAFDTAVIHELPDPSVRGGDTLGVIIVALRPPLSVQVACGNVCRFLSGNARKLDLNAEVVGKQLDFALLSDRYNVGDMRASTDAPHKVRTVAVNLFDRNLAKTSSLVILVCSRWRWSSVGDTDHHRIAGAHFWWRTMCPCGAIRSCCPPQSQAECPAPVLRLLRFVSVQRCA